MKIKGFKKIASIALACVLVAGTATIVSAAPGDVVINETNFPDENFRNFLLDTTYGEKPGSDGILTQAELANYTYLNCNAENISDLTGIEYFTALTELQCANNHLTSLDVSHNTALVELNCQGNDIASLDLSNNAALKSLTCGYNNAITSLDVSNHTVLETLDCQFCQGALTSIDVSGCTALKTLNVQYNYQLSSLNTSGCSALETVKIYRMNYHNGGTTVRPVAIDLSDSPVLHSFDGQGVSAIYTNLKLNLGYYGGGVLEVSNGGHEYFDFALSLSEKMITLENALTSSKPDLYTFVRWDVTGGTDMTTQSPSSGYGSAATDYIVGAEDVTITAIWNEAPSHTLTIYERYIDENNVQERVVTSREQYPIGATVTVTKTAPAGYKIWINVFTSLDESTQQVVMDDDKTMTFTYKKTPAPTQYTLTINEVYQDESGTEERTVTNTATYDEGATATITKTAPDGYSIIGDATQSVVMNSAKTMTFTYRRNATGTVSLDAESPVKMVWVGVSGDAITKRIGNVAITGTTKSLGKLTRTLPVTADISAIGDGEHYTLSVPNKNINLTINGETVAATVTFPDTDLYKAPGSPDTVTVNLTVTTNRTDLPFDDYFVNPISGVITVTATEV